MDDLDRPAFDGTELDFWLGEWECTWDGGHGTNRLSRILADKVILEEFEAAPDPDGSGAMQGRSWSVFDAGRGLWRQTWVDDQGSYFDLVGDTVDGSFAFARAAPERGPAARQRMVFRDVEADRFRWTWEFSPDDGATWVTRWEIAYRHR
ncbi:MAG TPA: hypothetical protein VMQ65_01000 [Candidatus Limnocylindria bacterium]|nr:hypothetical protein [Candidatus Limnocylindria bacterium]